VVLSDIAMISMNKVGADAVTDLQAVLDAWALRWMKFGTWQLVQDCSIQITEIGVEGT
jgi:hypothetical protein